MSVVVTTFNSVDTVERCLRAVRSPADGSVELIVVDNNSTDGTAELARAHADEVLTVGPERSAQRNAGARRAGGDHLLFLDVDMVPEPGVVGEVSELLRRSEVAAVIVPELSFGQGWWARCKSLEKRLVLGDLAVEAARGFRRADFEAVGGYDERLTACEDWDLSDRVLAANGSALGRTAAVIWHDEGRLRLRGTFAKKRYYGRWVRAWMAEAPPHRRRRSARGLTLMARQPLTGAGLVVMKGVEACGFAVGAIDAKRKAP